MFLQSLIFLLQPPKQRWRDRLLLPPVAGCDAAEASPLPTTPAAGQAIPLLTHTPCYSAAMVASHRSRTSEPSYSSPRGLPLPRLPRLRVIPFLGLAVVHRPGALSAAWSTWSRNDFHRKSTVRGEADSWVQGGRKEVPPYYTQNNYSSTCQQGPTRRTTLFQKKCFPLTAGTYQQHLRTQGSASEKKNDSPPDCWDPPATSSHARKCLTIGTHLVEAYVALSFCSRTCTYILVDVEALVARTRTYSGQCARKKIRPHTYIRAGSRTPTRAYVWPGLVYMAASERRNCVVVVFMGRQRNASCSSGGNETRGSQPAWT